MVVQSGWFQLNITSLANDGVIPDESDVLVTFARTGDAGATGSQGAQGETGTQGIQGTDGAQGVQGTQGISGLSGTYATTITPVSPYSDTLFALTHGLGTTDVQVVVYDTFTGGFPQEVVTDVYVVNSNVIDVVFAVAPTSGQTYRVVVRG